MEEVDRIVRRRPYEARDKERLIKRIIELHENGMSQVDIAKTLNISRGTILRWNKELELFKARKPGQAGKLKNKKYHYDENYFKNIDTPNKAYLVGYITGDGTLHDRGKSKRLILSLAKELTMQEAIKFRKRYAPNEQNKYSLIINSTEMCNDLMRLGIKPRKTGFESWIDFKNEDLQWTYLRGFFDADGHFSKRGRIGFTGNREMFLSLLKFLHNQQLALTVHKVYPKQGCVDLFIYRKDDVLKIVRKLYAHGSIQLNRKYEKIKSFFDDIV
ncbi:UNVERIFIED_CONTAM: helix-turn-helix resolvase-like protein [Lysinibacillus xylanilyticus]|uniref:helix-turn-helix domain-containing protein n=1 Tax=Lysinibacillus xylanilyticus TaxID=582475 RepID=UPI00069DD911|nr:helix-turn-helix domain-containing protein [Lysinibacillus xylanilyticus]